MQAPSWVSAGRRGGEQMVNASQRVTTPLRFGNRRDTRRVGPIGEGTHMTSTELNRPIPLDHRAEAARTFSDRDLQRELTIAAAARTATRRHLFDTLFEELQRRRRGGR
jgi:hypothetical protein